MMFCFEHGQYFVYTGPVKVETKLMVLNCLEKKIYCLVINVKVNTWFQRIKIY